MTFGCGHPRTPENSVRDGKQCRFCQRVSNIARQAERDQIRINEGRLYTLGERIARGIA